MGIKLRFPHTFSIIFFMIFLMVLLTHWLPSGTYDRKFDETTGRDLVVAGTYKQVESKPQGIIDAFSSFSRGIVDAAEVISYILIVGGAYGVILKTGAIDNGLKSVIKRLQGREFILIPIVMILFSLGGTTGGMYEETLAFYLIIIPLMIAAGYDAIVGLAVVMLGVGAGLIASITNPFATGIASQIAQTNIADGMNIRIVLYFLSLSSSIAYVLWYAIRIKKNPEKSIVYSLREDHKKHFSSIKEEKNIIFTFRQKLIILTFLLIIIIMMYSLIKLGWWIPQLTMLFLVGSMISAFLGGMNSSQYWDNFIEGAKGFLYAALVVGLSRALVMIAQDGVIMDTILHGIVTYLSGLSKGAFIAFNEFVQILVAILVPSSSAHAALTMPLMAPLADLFEVSRTSVIIAYQSATAMVNMFSPTAGVLMAAVAMSRITWGHWLKFVTPWLIIQLVISMTVLLFTI